MHVSMLNMPCFNDLMIYSSYHHDLLALYTICYDMIGYATAGLLITGLALIVISILFNAIVLSHEESAETQLYKGAAIVLSFLSFVVGRSIDLYIHTVLHRTISMAE